MGRRSTIKRLDPRIREAVDALLREDRATIDQIVAQIEQLGGAASRSAVGRYAKQAREQMARYREAQEVAKVWVGKLQENPDGDVGRLLAEMLRTVAFRTISDMEEREGEAGSEELFFLAKAIKELASADKLAAERGIRVREKLARLERDAAQGKKKGLDMETLKRVREEVYGLL